VIVGLRNVIVVAACGLAFATVGCYQQLWHLDPALTVTSLTATEAIASAPGTAVTTAISGPPGGPYRLRVQVGASVSVFTVTGGGDITS
jgi:hypothetical protein